MSEEKIEIMQKIENFDLKPFKYKEKHLNLGGSHQIPFQIVFISTD